ncbi:MAG: ribulokinase [Bacteroidetes bacterium]|nr:ribulokinase [Bacteroidota bacterium]
MSNDTYCIGVDFGTDSVRTIIADTATGREIAAATFEYPRWKTGAFCNPREHRFRQHPLDHIEGLEATIKECLEKAGPGVKAAIRAIGIATTGSTPVAVDHSGTPLSLTPEFAEDPDAMFILWKDHSAARQMEAINDHAKKFPVDYLKYSGGIYSSEWFWSKLLYVIRTNEMVRRSCYSWVEHCDWIPFLLTGGTNAEEIRRSVCAAGHKALWSPEWGGLPPAGFFYSLDPFLTVYSTLYDRTWPADAPAGTLCPEWAQRLGLSTRTIVAIGALDAHIGAVGGQIEPYYLSKVIGTSTCDMLVAPPAELRGKFVPGICGIVEDSIIPGMVGMEAGQSAFGDIFAWFKNLLSWHRQQPADDLLAELAAQAAATPVKEDAELSIDWFNGRRTPDADPSLKGAITGLTLASDAPSIFRSLVESACFGSKAIIQRFTDNDIPVKGLIGVGGISRKSPFVMQTMADITEMDIRVSASDQTVALGAAMFAATAAKIFPTVETAMATMGQGFDRTYSPNPAGSRRLQRQYARYKALAATQTRKDVIFGP